MPTSFHVTGRALPPAGSIAGSLRRRDESWDYAREPTKHYTHGFHTYPAMMIPQVAARLVDSLTRPGDTILDPFCGSGSVLVEAVALGRNAWGLDLNPLAILIARAKTTPIDPGTLQAGLAAIEARLPALLAAPPPPPPVPRLGFWFKPPVIAQLSALTAATADLAGGAVRDFFSVVLSETIRLASNTRSSEFKLYRYAPERLARHTPDALALFRLRAARNILAMARFAARPRQVFVHAAAGDSRFPYAGIPARSVDAVITSPPYGDSRTTVAYGQFSRLSSQWLGLAGETDLDRALLGGSPARGAAELPSDHLRRALEQIDAASPKRASEVRAFYCDLLPCLSQLAEALRPGGRAALVVGNRRVSGVQIPTDLIIAELGASLGLTCNGIIVRRIPSKRMPLRNSPSNVPGATAETMHHEFIVLMTKSAD